MVFSPSIFSAEVQAGFQKPSRYRVVFPLPQVFAGIQSASDALVPMEFYADSVDLVDVGFASRPIVRYGYGVHEKKPFTANFNDVMITFYNDSLSSNLNYFQQWANAIQRFNMSRGIVITPTDGSDPNSALQPYELAYKDDYVVDGMVTLMDNNDNDVVTYRMRRMWPTHIANVKLGWAIINDIMRITVIFNYVDWYIDTSLGGTMIDANSGTDQPGQSSIQQTAAQQYLNELYNPFNLDGPPTQPPQ